MNSFVAKDFSQLRFCHLAAQRATHESAAVEPKDVSFR